MCICVCRFAWCVECNGSCLFYGYDKNLSLSSATLSNMKLKEEHVQHQATATSGMPETASVDESKCCTMDETKGKDNEEKGWTAEMLHELKTAAKDLKRDKFNTAKAQWKAIADSIDCGMNYRQCRDKYHELQTRAKADEMMKAGQPQATGMPHSVSKKINVLSSSIVALVADDQRRLTNVDSTKLLTDARCFNPNDEKFIRKTISTRLGGATQVTKIVKHQIQKAV